MHLVAWSIAGLLTLFFLAHYTGFMLNIRNDLFFSPFHYTAGILVAILFYGYTNSYTIAVVGTLTVGFAWEIYEVLVWKYIMKASKYRPRDDDTRNDLLLDLVGSLTAVALIAAKVIS